MQISTYKEKMSRNKTLTLKHIDRPCREYIESKVARKMSGTFSPLMGIDMGRKSGETKKAEVLVYSIFLNVPIWGI